MGLWLALNAKHQVGCAWNCIRLCFDHWLQGCCLSLARYWQSLLLQRWLGQQVTFCFAELMLCHRAITNILQVLGLDCSSPYPVWLWKRLELTLESRPFPQHHPEHVHHRPSCSTWLQKLHGYWGFRDPEESWAARQLWTPNGTCSELSPPSCSGRRGWTGVITQPRPNSSLIFLPGARLENGLTHRHAEMESAFGHWSHGQHDDVVFTSLAGPCSPCWAIVQRCSSLLKGGGCIPST